jgi:hypothetical protein
VIADPTLGRVSIATCKRRNNLGMGSSLIAIENAYSLHQKI